MLGRTALLLALALLPAPASATISGTWRTLPSMPGVTRMSHDLVVDPVRAHSVVFGGYTSDANSALDQVLFFSPATGWSVPAASPNRPAPRLEASLVLDPLHDRLILFGGKNRVRYFGDVWELRTIGDSIAWRQLAVSPGPSPRETRMVYDAPRHRLLAVGGYGETAFGGNGPFNEVWALSLDTDPPVWSRVTTAGTPPTPRTAHSLVYDPIADRLLMFGGSDFGFYSNQVWSLELSSVPPAWVEHSATGAPPVGRYGSVMDFDAARNRLILWAGYRPGAYLSDAWVLWLDGLPRWEPVIAPLQPLARDFSAGYWDVARQALVMCGGNAANLTQGDAAELKLDEQPVPVLASLAEVEATSDHVTLTWQLAPGTPWADLERREANGTWRQVARLLVGSGEHVSATDTDVTPGETIRYRLALPQATGTAYTDEVEVRVPLDAQLRFAGATPNPASDGVWVSFELPARMEVTLELFDVNGRRVAGAGASEGAGAHRVRLASTGELPAGLYFVRFRAGGLTRESRVIVSR